MFILDSYYFQLNQEDDGNDDDGPSLSDKDRNENETGSETTQTKNKKKKKKRKKLREKVLDEGNELKNVRFQVSSTGRRPASYCHGVVSVVRPSVRL